MSKKTKDSTTTGLQPKLPSFVRTDRLQKFAASRGIRLRTLRTLLHLTIEEFSDKTHQNSGTVGRIERGETCLSINLARWISKFAIENGVLVTSNWLLYGNGDGPQVIRQKNIDLIDFMRSVDGSTNSKDGKVASDGSASSAKQNTEEYKLLSSHLISQLFARLHAEHVLIYVKDHKMSPVYKKGETLGGIKFSNEDLNLLNGEDVIVETKTGFSARIFHMDSNGSIILSCYESQAYSPEVITRENVKSIYKVIWRYTLNMDQEDHLTLVDMEV